jgi:hypothetical protein
VINTTPSLLGSAMAARRDVPHKGTPTFYGLTPVKDRMPHKGIAIRYGLKPVRNRMPYTR